MKKLLSVLFILGSVAALANDGPSTLPTDVDPAFCFSNPCSAEDKFNVNVRVPEQLVIKVDDVEFGLWCGTKTVSKDFTNAVKVNGEKNQNVKLGFKNSGNLYFNDGLALKFTGKVAFAGGAAEESVTLNGSGAAQTGLKVTVNKPAIPGLLTAGKTYTAHATVVGSYDGF
ncbi:MAG: hypothetical protein ACRC1R_09655 [Cetobacterium sp.]|uniref:hypothetical protein n=1 Tax=Cetobacterium sp. TaxID=2071632 RepID=UPI0025BC383B|nr:hypothetical protein [Cetobacterium sp.]